MRAPSRCPHRSERRPPASSTTAPNTGNASISHAACWKPTAGTVVMVAAIVCTPAAELLTPPPLLVLQQAGVVYRRRPAGPEDRHQDRQAYHDLCRGDHHYEERDHLAIQVAVHTR